MRHRVPDTRGPAAFWLEAWQEMYRQWLNTMMPLSNMPYPGSSQDSFPPAPGGYSHMETHDAPDERVLNIEFETTVPARISIQIFGKPCPGPLSSELRREGEGDHRITTLAFDAALSCIRLTGQPPCGTYRGVVLDAQHKQCGTVCIQVLAQQAP